MLNYNPYYRNYPYSMYNYRNNYNNYNNYYTTSTTDTNNNIPNSNDEFEETIKTDSSNNNNNNNNNSETNQNITSESKPRNEKENGFRIGPLTVSNDQIEIFGFSFAIDDLIIIGLMLIIFLDSESDFILLIILGLMLFNISFSSLNLF